MKKILNRYKKRTFVSFLVMGLLILVLLKFIGWNSLYSATQSIKPVYLVTAFMLSVLILFVKTGAWQIFLVKLGYPLKFLKTFVLIYATEFLHTFIPLGAIGSKPVTAYLLHKNSEIPTEKGLAAITAADIVRLGTLYFLAWIGLIFFMIYHEISYISWVLVGIGLAGGVLWALVFLILWEKENWLDIIGLFFGRVVGKVRSFFKGKSKTWQKHFQKEIEMEIHIFENTLHNVMTNIGNLGKTFILASVEWFLTIILLYVLLYSLGISVSWFILVLIIPLSSLSAFLPLPGGFGGVEITMGGLLILLAGVSAAQAAVATLLFRAFYSWIPVFFGGWAVSFLSETKISPMDLIPNEVIQNPLQKN